MKKILVLALALSFSSLKAQQKNALLDQAFWKNSPNVEAVKAEIAKGNSPSEFNPFTFDPVCLAINNGAPLETIKFLIDQQGNSVSKITHDARIYLHWAAYKGNVELVQYLIGKGSDINLEDSHEATPLVFAAGAGQANPALYEAFFKAGLDAKKKYKNEATLLHLSIAADKDLTLANYLVTKGLSLNDADKNGYTVFDYAARSGNIKLLKTLKEKGVKHSDNALLVAAEGSRRSANTLETYQYLVDEVKIKPTATTKNGENVLHLVARKPNQTEIIKYFLQKGVEANQADKEGNNALMVAASGEDVSTLETLLPKIKNINVANNKGETALAIALRYGSSDVVAFLLKNGADTKATDKSGNNLAYYWLQSYRPQGGRGEGGRPMPDFFEAKMKLLQEKGFNLTAAQKDGNTLYHLAVAKNDLALLQKIAALGIDLNAKNKEGMTALHKAALLAKDDTILKYLVSVGAKKDIKTDFDETAYNLAKENEFLTKNNVSVDFLK